MQLKIAAQLSPAGSQLEATTPLQAGGCQPLQAPTNGPVPGIAHTS